MQLETKIYQKENNLKIGKLLQASAKDFFSSHFLAKQLATRDIKSQYRQSYLGIIWAFITPITSAFVWLFLNLTGTIKLSDTEFILMFQADAIIDPKKILKLLNKS